MININVWNICAVHNSPKYKQYVFTTLGKGTSNPWNMIRDTWTAKWPPMMRTYDIVLPIFKEVCLPLILPREVMNIIEISTRKIRIVWQTIRNPLVWDFVILIDAALLGTSGPQSYEQGDVILWRKWPINNGPGDRKNISAGLWAWYEQRARAATHY